MNVDQATLDMAARTCYSANQDLATMRDKANRNGAGKLAGELDEIRARVWFVAKDLLDAGAADPRPDRPAAEQPAETPLHLLDTPANRELLRCLLLTMDAALAVDKERGHDGDGFAEVIEHFAARVQTEVHGPADLRQGRPGEP